MKVRNICNKMAICFALFLAVLEALWNWGSPSWWPFILVDYILVALLLYGALRSYVVLVGAWGFSCSLFYIDFFLTIQKGSDSFLIVGSGALFALTIIGFLMSLYAGSENDT